MLGSSFEGNNNGKRRISEDLTGDTTGKRVRNGDQTIYDLTQYQMRFNALSRQLSHEDYTVGWICALPLEMTAARAMLDEEHIMLPIPDSDQNVYTLGSISGHNVVIVCLPAGVYGLTSATAVGLSMRSTFPNSVNMPLMVGIGGGVPSNRHDIRLGDVAVSHPSPESPAVKQYDYGKTIENGILECRGTLNKPAHGLLNAVASLRAQHDLYATQIPLNISMALDKYSLPQHRYPGVAEDVLHELECEHFVEALVCEDCGPLKQVRRSSRPNTAPIVHYGSIASGNQVIKHARTRDRLARQHDIICFEMEAAGLMDHLPCLVIRGISDYCDTYKHKQFQGYAALAAAAYAKELLSIIPVKQSTFLSELSTRTETEIPTQSNGQLLEHCRSILEALNFDEAESRRDTVKNAHSQTCRWILDRPEYTQWLDPDKFYEHHGLFWIKGKPATGKSTIMKYAFEQAKKQRSDSQLVISFFFNARGHDLEKTTLGMYRSLLFQLLSQARDLQSLLRDIKSTVSFDQGDLNLLVRLFKKTLEQLQSRQLLCFVDALDECPEAQIREMLETFVQAANIRFLLCFSSRHYPNISVDTGIQLVLEDQAGHSQDLKTYITSELKVGKSKRAELLKQAIFQKSNGIFLWVALVVGILRRENDRGRVHNMERRLDEIPIELNDLFRDIILRDSHDLPELVLCIQWILYAQRPLQRAEFYFALLSANDRIDLGPWDPEEITTKVMDNYILDCSKGLAELTRGKTPTVQFIHESVREFLLDANNALVNLYSGFQDIVRGKSHQRLKECCYRWVDAPIIKEFMPSCTPENLPPANSAEITTIRKKAESMFPFLGYAAHFVLLHADQAQHSQIQQLDFLRIFKWPCWNVIYNTMQRFGTRRLDRRPENCTFSFCLAKLSLQHLFQIWYTLPNSDSFFEILKNSLPVLDHESFTVMYKAKFHASKHLSHKHMEQISILFTFLKRVAEIPFWKREMPPSILHLISEWDDNVFEPHFRDALRETAHRKDVITMQLLLDHHNEPGNVDLGDLLFEVLSQPASLQSKIRRGNAKTDTNEALLFKSNVAAGAIGCISILLDRGGSLNIERLIYDTAIKGMVTSPLVRAAYWADISVVEFLLSVQSFPDSKTLDESLFAAVRGENLEVAELLLQRGADVKSSDEHGNTVLHNAVRLNSEAAVKLILDWCSNVDQTNKYGRTALDWACDERRTKIIQLLIDHGAQVNTSRAHGNSLLHLLASDFDIGNLFVLQRLIGLGVQINGRNEMGETPLHLAAKGSNSRDRILLLIASGAEIDSRTRNNKTPLHYAAEAGCNIPLEVLIEKGAQMDLKDNIGQTSLHCAAWRGRNMCLEVLIEKGAQIDLKDDNGRTALHMLMTASLPSIKHIFQGATIEHAINLLVRGGADLEATDNLGRTSLHLALYRTCSVRYTNIVAGNIVAGNIVAGKTLFECGANPDLGLRTEEKDEEWNWMCEFIHRVKFEGRWPSLQEVEADKQRPVPQAHRLQDYQMQLMLLEQQNKKRLLMAAQSQTGSIGVEGCKDDS